MMPGLADHLAAPPAAYAHLPYDASCVTAVETLLSLKPANIRLLACKRSWDGEALIVRLQEAVGKRTKAELCIMPAAAAPFQERRHASQESGHEPEVNIPMTFAPFEIKTLRIEKDGSAAAVRMIEEDRP
jgi:alpha-mannosidase